MPDLCEKKGNHMKAILPVFFAFICLFLFSNIVSASDPIEYQLAVIDAGGIVPKDHISVARYRSLLTQLSKKYIEDKQQIADMTVLSQNMLRKKGIKESLLNIMEGLNVLFSEPLENQQYAEYAAMYVTVRSEEGYSHSEALQGIKALLQSLGIS